jgi:hypothetical protein
MAFKGKPSVLRGLGRIKIQQVVGLLVRFRPPVRLEMFYDWPRRLQMTRK